MTTTPMNITLDAITRVLAPVSNFGQTPYLPMYASGGDTVYSWVYVPRLSALNASVISAKLRFWLRNAWAASDTTVTVRRITGKWSEATLNYNNRPPVDLTASASVVVPASSPGGTLVEIDVTAIMQTVANGAPCYGFRIESSASYFGTRFHSSESTAAALRPAFTIEWNIPPANPTDLKPSGGLSVSVPSPTCTWRYNDTEGENQNSLQVQVFSDAGVTMIHDSGWVVSDQAQYDLSAAVGGAVVVADGVTRWWKVRVKDNYGAISGWSDLASFRRDIKAVLTITNPPAPAANTVEETTPPITYTFVGRTQKMVQHVLWRQDPTDLGWDLIYDSGRIATGVMSYTIPSTDAHGNKLIEAAATNYRVEVRVWDDISRVATPGDPVYTMATRDFTYVPSGTPAAVLTLVVTDGTGNDMPGTVLTWTRTAQPDYFAIKVDGKYVLDRIDSDDVLVGAPNYRYVLWRLEPRKAHTIEVEAVVLDTGKYKHSTGNPSVSFTPTPRGIWLIAPGYGLRALFTGSDSQDKKMGQTGTTYYLPNRQDPVRVRDRVGGYEGTLTGKIRAAYGHTAKEWKSWLERISALPVGTEIRAIFGGNNFPVTLDEATIGEAFQDTYPVSVPYWQSGEFAVRMRQ